MSEDVKIPIGKLLGQNVMNNVLKELYDKRSSEAPFDYPEIKRSLDDKDVVIKAKSVDLHEVMGSADSSCKHCGYGKGYFVSNLRKDKYPDPSGFMIFKPEMEVPDGLPEEEKEKLLAHAKEKYEKSPFWRILNICSCAAKNTLKRKNNVYSNELNNIFIELDYQLVEKAQEV